MESDRIVPFPFSSQGSAPELPEFSRSYEEDCAAPRCFSYAEAAAASDSSLLDHQETSLHVASDSLDYDSSDLKQDVAFRHSYWQHRRERVYRVLQTIGHDPMRVHRFAHCGAGAWVQRAIGEKTKFRVISAKCHDRFCEACQREKRLKISRNLMSKLPDGRVRFVTLTLRSSATPLDQQIDRMLKAFAKMRRGRRLSKCFVGGIWFLEVTKNAKTNLWHPHVHCLVQGDYIPLDLLRLEWHRCTGDSYIVDVRDIKHVKEVCGYVTKYAAKAVNLAALQSEADLAEAMAVFRGQRMFAAFGTWVRLKLSATCESDVEWEYYERLATIRRKAKDGDDVAIHILHALRAVGPITTEPYEYIPPPF